MDIIQFKEILKRNPYKPTHKNARLMNDPNWIAWVLANAAISSVLSEAKSKWASDVAVRSGIIFG